MTCEQIQELLWDYCFELLEPGQSRRVAEHLSQCPPCARGFEGLRELLGSWRDVPAPPGLAQRALEAAKAPRGPAMAGEVRRVGWHVVTRWLVAAGVLAAVVLSGVYVHLAGLRPGAQDTMVIAPRRFVVAGPMATLAAAHGAVRVTVTNGEAGTPVALSGGDLQLLHPDSGSRYYALSMFDADRTGMTAAEFTLPGGLPDGLPATGSSRRGGSAPAPELLLGVRTVSELGDDSLTLPVALARAYRALLETDRYYYRPGETLRVRGVLLNQVTLEPEPELAAEVRLLDSAGRPLITKETTCSPQGLFGVELALPVDLAPGEYRLAVSADRLVGEQAIEVVEGPVPTTGERAVALHLGPRRTWYRPGEMVEVTIRARGPRGEPIAGAYVEVRATVDRRPVGPAVSARTDSRGRGTVSLPLPEVLPAAAEDGDGGVLRLEARLKQDEEVLGLAEAFVGVSREPVRIAVRPEAGVLVPGVENLLYVLVTRPDGAPTSAQVTLRSDEGTRLVSQTDELGLAALALTPSEAGLKGTLVVRDDLGYQRRLALDLPIPDPAPTVLVRPERWYNPSDEPLSVTVLGPKDADYVLLDVSLNGQLALVRKATLTDGVGQVDLALPEYSGEMVGVLELRGYLPGASGPAGSVARRVCVGPSQPLLLQLHAKLAGAPERRLTLSVGGRGEQEGSAWLSVAVSALPPGSEDEPANWRGRYLLGDRPQEDAPLRAWVEKRALDDLFPPAGGLADRARADRLALALLGAGDQLLPEGSFVAGSPATRYSRGKGLKPLAHPPIRVGRPVRGPVGEAMSARSLQVKRTYPAKVASVARTQARFLPPVGTGLWVVAWGLGLIGLAALLQALWHVGKRAPAGSLAQTAVAWVVAVLVVAVVLPRADSPQAYSQIARLAEAEALPEVLTAAAPPTFLAGEGPISLPPVRLAGREPRTLLWKPELQTDGKGTVELDLPQVPAEGRVRVSILALVNGQVTGATFVLGADTTGQTVALLSGAVSAWPR